MEAAPGRVVVAMSGGVDSSLAAALLQQQGHEVLGLTLDLNPCAGGDQRQTASAAAASAREVARQLRIPHRVLNGREEFDQQVLAPAWQDYSSGRTPNPCTVCNPHVKFSLLLREADRAGARWIATGHYARIQRDPGSGRASLWRGLDRAKDQSYFLFALQPQQLQRVLFPVGELTKGQVRGQARRLGLASAERAESQDACLADSAGEGFSELLRRRFDAPPRPGTLESADGRVLGRHAGVHAFTIGQRRGLGVALGRRAYVVAIEPDAARVVLSDDQRALSASGLVAGGPFRWLTPPPDEGELRVEVQIRSRHRPAPARARQLPDRRVSVGFDDPQRAITPGQAAVLYDGDRLLGGGWIERAID